ncbi:alpha/beta-hydrolase [Violaceomyces palustris]|uniref:Alpha/beta-hydrolase n=1 Tax=Violaceomyces palustris TaxID=1673888 RepID=A0ACD0NQK1_9BASI|nr:alpha/beta-hydrolase [Violaceomyces palustris]
MQGRRQQAEPSFSHSESQVSISHHRLHADGGGNNLAKQPLLPVSPPPSPTYYPSSGTASPPSLPKGLPKLLGTFLKASLIPTVAFGLLLWPLLAALSAIPIVGVVAIPVLLLLSIILLYSISWLSYLSLAQPDLPSSWSSRRISFTPFLPYSPVRCVKVVVASFNYVITAINIIIPAVFDWSYRRVMVLGTQKGSKIVKEGILYGSPTPGKRLDIYLPPSPSQSPSSATTGASAGAPVVVVVPSMMAPLSWTSKRKLYLQLALRLRRMGYCVVVPDITYFPESRIKSSIIDLRLVLRWVGKHCERYGGDPSKIHVMGHGLSSHLIMLTLAQEAVVLSREGHLDRAYMKQKGMEMWEERNGNPDEDDDDDDDDGEWMKSGEVGSEATEVKVNEGDAWVDEPLGAKSATSRSTRSSSGSYELPPGAVMGSTGRFDESGGSSGSSSSHQRPASVRDSGLEGFRSPPQTRRSRRKVGGGAAVKNEYEDSYGILNSTAYKQAEEEVGNGLKRVSIYEPEIVVPPIAGVILLSGVSDVIKGFRSESEKGTEHLSFLRRSTGPSHINCLLHSPAHLLYAAKNILDTRLLPPKFLLVHGGKDRVVPVEQSTLLKTLLVGVGVDHVKLRAYRHLGHAESIACLFLGMGKSSTRYTRQILDDIAQFVAI